MRLAAVTLAALAAAGCGGRGGSDEAATSPTADLTIEISIRGSEAPTKVWTLQCPAGGTLPDAATACTKLGEIDDPFAPVPKGTACTQVYRGPEIAHVSGTFNGEPVDTEFSRGNGCDIERGQGRLPLPEPRLVVAIPVDQVWVDRSVPTDPGRSPES